MIVGTGSAFTVTLRTGLLDEKVVLEGKRETRHVLRLLPGTACPKIMVVDDQADNRRLLSELLTGVGYAVVAVSNGMEAVSGFNASPPDAIIMDLRMPLMDGAEATRQIRGLPRGDKVRIIGLSASVIRDLRDPMPGVDAFMGKPFRDDDLLECLRGLLDVRYEYQTASQPMLPEPTRIQVPDVFVAPLREALTAADLDAVLAQLAKLNDIAPAAARELRVLAQRFDWDGIAALLPVKKS